MRLSDIRGERTLDVIADLIEPISNIATDKELMDSLKAAKGKSEDSVRNSLAKLAPTAIKSHKDDVITILATIKGVTKDEYRDGMNLANLLTDLIDLLNDEEFVSFFISSGKTAQGSIDG